MSDFLSTALAGSHPGSPGEILVRLVAAPKGAELSSVDAPSFASAEDLIAIFQDFSSCFGKRDQARAA